MLIMIVTGCSNGRGFGKKLAKHLKARYVDLFKEHFPDGEGHLKFKAKLSGTVVLVQSLAPRPDENLTELLFAIYDAKKLGAEKVIVVAPYLCYMRQDKRFTPLEVKSNEIVAHLIQKAGADALYTVSPHVHRIGSLSELFSIKAVNVHIYEEMARWVKKTFGKNVVIVGPDIESWRVGKKVAQLVGCQYDTFLKKRFSGSRIKHTAVAKVEARGKHVVIIDDIISTGGTILGAAKHLKKMGAKSVSAVCVHLMTREAGDKLVKKGIRFVAASNTISSKYSVLDASKAVARAIRAGAGN